MYSNIKRQIWQANLDLVKFNLVTLTWGNACWINRESGVIIIKYSGVLYEKLKKRLYI